MTTAPPRRLVVATLLAVLLAMGGIVAEVVAWQSGHEVDALVDLLAGWALIGMGLAATATAPRSREGTLLLLTAAGWFVGTVVAPTTELGRTDAGRLVGQLWQLHAGFLIHAIATWPSGRIERPIQRLTVVGGYVAALFPQLWTTDPAYLVLGALLAGGILLDRRSLSPTQQRALAPARDAGLLLAAVIAGLPFLTELLQPMELALASTGANLYALAVAATAGILSVGLVRRSRPGVAADVAIELDPDPLASTDDLARRLGELLGDDDPEGGATRRAVERAMALSARNRALRAALRRQVVELEASRRRVVEAGDQERRMLLERLRSGPGGRLERLGATLRTLAFAPGQAVVTGHVARALELSGRAAEGLTSLADRLDPGGVSARGLVPALRDLAASSPVTVMPRLPDAGPTEPTIARTLYFIAAESLANVVRHAEAGAAWITLVRDAGGWRLTVEDDGVGGADATRGSGLQGLRERTEAVGGTVGWEDRPAGGTRVVAILPLHLAGEASS